MNCAGVRVNQMNVGQSDKNWSRFVKDRSWTGPLYRPI